MGYQSSSARYLCSVLFWNTHLFKKKGLLVVCDLVDFKKMLGNKLSMRMLFCADLTIVDALNLGDKLQSLLYYHFLPSAHTSNQLVAAGTLNTDLGISTGMPYNLTFGTAQDGTAKVTFKTHSMSQ